MSREFQEIFEELDNEMLTTIHPSTRKSTGVLGGAWNYVGHEVDDFEAAVKELEAAGVDFNFGPLETLVCHMAFVRDPDGNSVGIHRRKGG